VDERQALLLVARRALEAALCGAPEGRPAEASAALRQPGGAFVTLRRHGALRGCIGRLVSDRPLGEVVASMAVAAATQDPRFVPVPPDELPDLEIEISVLSEPVPLASHDSEGIRPGRDGIVVRRGRRQGLLLPQVAVEHGWDAEALLAAVCRKAGLPPDAWRGSDCDLFVFQADVFTS
jgi:AmmeMemoRadiSam system protein A